MESWPIYVLDESWMNFALNAKQFNVCPPFCSEGAIFFFTLAYPITKGHYFPLSLKK